MARLAAGQRRPSSTVVGTSAPLADSRQSEGAVVTNARRLAVMCVRLYTRSRIIRTVMVAFAGPSDNSSSYEAGQHP